jgi:hypothetical protein
MPELGEKIGGLMAKEMKVVDKVTKRYKLTELERNDLLIRNSLLTLKQREAMIVQNERSMFVKFLADREGLDLKRLKIKDNCKELLEIEVPQTKKEEPKINPANSG